LLQSRNIPKLKILERHWNHFNSSTNLYFSADADIALGVQG